MDSATKSEVKKCPKNPPIPLPATPTPNRYSKKISNPALAAPTAIGGERDGAVGAPAMDGVVEPGTAGVDPGAGVVEDAHAAPHVEHVPIKRKGARKR